MKIKKITKNNWPTVFLYWWLSWTLYGMILYSISFTYLFSTGLYNEKVMVYPFPRIINVAVDLNPNLSATVHGNNFEVTKLQGDIKTSLESWHILSIYTLTVLFVYGCVIAILILLRKIVYSVYMKEPFSVDNCKRLKIITWIILLAPIFLYLFSLLIVNSLPDPVYINNNKITVHANYYIWEGIISGLIIHSISQVYIKGVELREDQDLTI